MYWNLFAKRYVNFIVLKIEIVKKYKTFILIRMHKKRTDS